MNRRIHRRPVILILVALAFGAACRGGDGGATAPPPLTVAELILESAQGEIAHSHRGHWHGAPAVREGSNASYTLWWLTGSLAPDDHDAPPRSIWMSLQDHPDHSVHVVIEDPTIASWSGGRTAGTLTGIREGASRVSFVVRRGTTTIYEAPPLNFRVLAP